MAASKHKLKPIPTPWRAHWRALRMRLLPVIVFAGAVAGVAWIWQGHVAPAGALGIVEPVRGLVASPEAGALGGMRVKLMDHVRAGDPIVELFRTDPEVVQHSLAMIGAEIELLRVGMDPLLNHERNLLNEEGLRLNNMLNRVDLATTKVRLRQAEADYQRAQRMLEAGLIATDEYDAMRNARDALATEIRELESVVVSVDGRLEERARINGRRAPEDEDARAVHLRAAIAVQEERLRLTEAELRPLTIRASADGMVSAVHRRGGEHVAGGEPLVSISAYESDRVLAYLRQPVRLEPEVGMLVEVRARGGRRASAEAEVISVGNHFEPIPAELQGPMNVFDEAEMGLPIMVSLPPGLGARPGEILDISLQAERLPLGRFLRR